MSSYSSLSLEQKDVGSIEIAGMNPVESAESDVESKQEPSTAPNQTETATFSELFAYAEAWDVFLMIVGSISGIATGCAIPVFNVIFGRMLDALNTDPTSFSRRINGISLIFVFVGIVNLFTGLLQVVCWTQTGERMSQRYREAYVNAILRQDIGWFDSNGSAQLTTKVADLSGKLQDGLTRKVGDLFQYFGQFFAAFGVGLYLCWKLTVVLLAAFPLIGIAGAYMINAITSAVNDSAENYASAGGLATEALGAIRTVTALNAQLDVISRYRMFLLDAMHIGIKKGFKVGVGNGGIFAAAFLTYALGFWYGGKLVADDIDRKCDPYAETCLTGGTVLAVFFSVIMGSLALGQIVPPISAFFAAKASVKPMLNVINRKPAIDGLSTAGISHKENSRGHVELQHLNFCYPSRPDVQVCKDYSLSILSGETVALVGASGSGKSTIVNLLMRFYDPQAGKICLDGTDIKDLNIKWLRSQFGYVGQEPVLFSGSIKDNIGYGLDEEFHPRDDTYFEKIIAAAKLANAYNFIQDLPEKFDTDVGSAGIALSGGQKQRIAIARALVKKPSVLLLDEATSALDAASERIVQESIDKLQQSKAQTTIVIAHRLSTIRNADKIAVIDKGSIVEMGTHDQLVSIANGRYADLVRLQMTDDLKKDENVTISDSASPLKPSAETEAEVTTNVLEGPDADKVSSTVMSRVWTIIRDQPFWLSISLLGAGVFGAMFPCWGLLISRTQNMFYFTDTDKLRTRSVELSMWYLGLAAAALSSSILQYWGSAQVGERLSMKLRSFYFESMLRREISYFDKVQNSTGALTTRLSDDSRTVSKATSENVPRLLQAAFTLCAGMGIAFSANAKLAAVVLATFPVIIAASAIQMQAIAGQQYDTVNKGAGSGGLISSAFTNMRTVSAFSMQYKVANEYTMLTRMESLLRRQRSWVAGFGFGGSQACTMSTYALLFWYGSKLIEKNEVNFEDMMAAILSLMLGALGLGQAVSGLGDQREGLIAAKRIFATIDSGIRSSCDGLSTDGVKPESRPSGQIELKNVSFHYPTRPEIEVCKNFNLIINPGEVVALVGPSGSGKSTIINLLLRFYEPDCGDILLDGMPINTLNVRWLRSQIGYVGQEPILFKGSVEDNIARGRAEYGSKHLLTIDEALQRSDDLQSNAKLDPLIAGETQKDVIEAATSANAHDFISEFTHGYATEVGEASMMISGGQKQRIAIARALVKKPSVLLLDEATSALDAASERIVQESIDKLQQSKAQTTIVIAHRLLTVRNADKIAVIDKGCIVQLGTHDQLLSDQSGLYYSLWTKQSGNK